MKLGFSVGNSHDSTVDPVSRVTWSRVTFETPHNNNSLLRVTINQQYSSIVAKIS